MLADIGVVQTLFNRPNLIQSVRIKLANQDVLPALQSMATLSPQIGLTAAVGTGLFRGACGTDVEADPSYRLASGNDHGRGRSGRRDDDHVQLCFGSQHRDRYRPSNRLQPACRLCRHVDRGNDAHLPGSVIGIGFSYLVLNGWTASTMSADHTQIGFQLTLSPSPVMKAVWLSLIIGAIGGALPA